MGYISDAPWFFLSRSCFISYVPRISLANVMRFLIRSVFDVGLCLDDGLGLNTCVFEESSRIAYIQIVLFLFCVIRVKVLRCISSAPTDFHQQP